MAIDCDALQKLRPQAYAAIRDDVRDGDLLFCSATDGFSRLIRWATKSPWSHVAIAYRLEEIDRVHGYLEVVWRKIGVRAVPLSTFISRTSTGVHPYPGKILLARHAAMAAKSRRKPWKKIADFAFDRLGDQFSPGEIAKIALSHRHLGRCFSGACIPTSAPRMSSFARSMLLVRCFKTVGVERSRGTA